MCNSHVKFVNLYFHRTPTLLPLLYPSLVWHKNRSEKHIYLTFDDGPVPGATEFVLEMLGAHNALASFFCVGENISRHPEIFQKVIAGGHTVGNHTFNHLNGWKTPHDDYLANTGLCEQAMGQHSSQPSSNLFRPPYGRMTKRQIRGLAGQYSIIMWDVLSGDFDRKLTAERCLAKTIQYTGNGSIVIFHDSYKAAGNLRYVLPRFLDHFASNGYLFKAL